MFVASCIDAQVGLELLPLVDCVLVGEDLVDLLLMSWGLRLGLELSGLRYLLDAKSQPPANFGSRLAGDGGWAAKERGFEKAVAAPCLGLHGFRKSQLALAFHFSFFLATYLSYLSPDPAPLMLVKGTGTLSKL